MEHQYASDLLELERLHLLKLVVWSALSILAGSFVVAALRVRRSDSALLRHFALQSIAWGLVDLGIVAWAWNGLELRDLAAATQLDRFIWLNIGLDVGYVLVGLTLAICGWRLGKRLGLVGAGVGVAVQGIALAVLDLQLSAGLVR